MTLVQNVGGSEGARGAAGSPSVEGPVGPRCVVSLIPFPPRADPLKEKSPDLHRADELRRAMLEAARQFYRCITHRRYLEPVFVHSIDRCNQTCLLRLAQALLILSRAHDRPVFHCWVSARTYCSDKATYATARPLCTAFVGVSSAVYRLRREHRVQVLIAEACALPSRSRS